MVVEFMFVATRDDGLRNHKDFWIILNFWGARGHLLWLGEVRCSPPPSFLTSACALSISLLASVFPVSLPLFFLFFRSCLIHARMPEGGRAFVHGHTFLHSWSGPMTVVVGLLHGATFLSGLPLVLFVSFIRLWQLERTLIKSLLIIIILNFWNNSSIVTVFSNIVSCIKKTKLILNLLLKTKI